MTVAPSRPLPGKPYAGYPVGCTVCAYDLGGGRGPCPVIPRATRVVLVRTVRPLEPGDDGHRQLCDAHALAAVRA